MVTEKLSATTIAVDQRTKDWWDSELIPFEYASYSDESVNMLEPFPSMSDKHLGRIFTVKHRVDLESPSIRPIQFDSYCSTPKSRDYKTSEIDKMFAMKVKGSSQTE